MILGDIVCSARRRFLHRNMCPGALEHSGTAHGHESKLRCWDKRHFAVSLVM